MSSVDIRDLHLSFGSIDVLSDLNLSVEEGEFLVLLARTIHETPNSFTEPFSRSEFCEGAEYRLYCRLSRICYGERGRERIW